MSTQHPPARPRRRSLLASALVLGAIAPFASLSQTKSNAMTPTIIKAIAQREAMTCDVASTVVA